MPWLNNVHNIFNINKKLKYINMFILGYKCEEQSDKDLVSGDEKK
jgi:hypothetical protein